MTQQINRKSNDWVGAVGIDLLEFFIDTLPWNNDLLEPCMYSNIFIHVLYNSYRLIGFHLSQLQS